MRTLAIVTFLLAGTAAAQAAEINAFISTAIKAATDELLPPFERANGYTIRASYAPSGALIPRFDRGEPVDVFLTDSAAIDELIKQGKVMTGRTDLARTGIGIAIYSAGVTTSAGQTGPAKAFIRHLAAPEAMTIYKTKGLAL